jgi:hypothetical protein
MRFEHSKLTSLGSVAREACHPHFKGSLRRSNFKKCSGLAQIVSLVAFGKG